MRESDKDRAQHQYRNPLLERVAKIEGRSQAEAPRDLMLWLRRWAALNHSATFQYGIGGLAGMLFAGFAGAGPFSAAGVLPIALGAGMVSLITSSAYTRLLHAEITRFVAEHAPVRRATILLHLRDVISKKDNLSDRLAKLTATGRIRLEDGHYLPVTP